MRDQDAARRDRPSAGDRIPSATGAHRPATVRAWDLPTRLFKWSLVLLVATAWLSSGFADPTMKVHKLAGYGILTLLVYRVLWGLVGSTTARFASFAYSPREVIGYLRAVRLKRTRPYLGHNPAGGLMVLAILAACSVQAVLGLFATDGVTASGPFADMVGETLSSLASQVHEIWFKVILALSVVHIAANLYYQFVKRENLIGAMITGRKPAMPFADAQRSHGGSPLRALICLLVAAGVVYFGITTWGGGFFGDV